MVPVNMTDTTGAGIVSVDLSFEYDSTVLEPVYSSGTQVMTAPGD